MDIQCANCNNTIHEGDECVVVRDNFLLTKYFEARGYVFCNEECLMNYISADLCYWEDN